MRKNSVTVAFWISAAGFFLMALAVFLFYPSSYLELNRGDERLAYAASAMFWVGLLSGIIAQIVATVLRNRKDNTFARMYHHKLRKKGVSRLRRSLPKGIVPLVFAALFLIGLVGSIISLIQSLNSSYHTFFFLALTVLGLFEYIVFNSINFIYIKRSEEDAN